MAPATTSPTIALLTATAVAAAGIAYWSSASNTTAFGALVLEILRVTGTIEENEKNDKKSSNSNSNNNSNSNSNSNISNDEEEDKTDKLNNAFVSWLDKEEKENNFPHPWNNIGKKKDKDLTDPHWMSETIRNALLSTAMAAISAAVTETATARTVMEDESSALSTSSSAETEIIQETMLSPISQLMDDEIETICETAFRRSFRSLQKATEAMIRKEPAIREDFFNGVFVDEENDQREEEKKQERRLRSLSLSSASSSSSYWSVITSSTGSHEVNRDDRLVEEEEEVERLLTYLRFVELAKEEALSSSLSGSSKDYPNRTTRHIRRRSEQLFPDVDGYELLRSTTMEIQDATDSRRAKLGYTAAVHRGRKELVIAVHYDGLPLSSSTIDDRNRIKTILMSSLFLQQEEHSAIIMAASPSSSFLLLDQAVKSLYEEILLRYLHTNTGEVNEVSPSFLSFGYSLVLCGHSLGAALACKLGDMLTHRNRDTVSKSIKVRVSAFGPPPCLPSRQRFGQDGGNPGGDYSYITSVVNNHDCVPRWTESNLVGLRMSLRWTMDQKRRHFQKYNNRYNRSRPSTHSVTADKTSPVRRRPQRIPAFSVSSRDWNTFWKSNQEPNNAFLPQGDIDEVGPKYIVPGKVVSIWNHSQDPTIIGAKVHLPGTKHRHPSSSNCHQLLHHHRGNRDILGRLWVAEGMFSDHTIEAYRSNLELLLGQLANTI